MKLKSVFRAIYFKFISANKVASILDVKFGSNCLFRTKKFGSEPYLIKVGNNFKTAGNVQFVTHDGAVHVVRNLYEKYNDIDLIAPIIAGDNIFIGYGTVILPGTVMGNNVIVGAGSIVKGELKSNSVYAGVPVKYICSIEDYIHRNKSSFVHIKGLDRETKKEYIKNKLISKRRI